MRGLTLVATILVMGLFWASVARADLAEGDAAPDFSMRGSDGNDYTLSQFRGKKGVVLAWFPKAFTPG